MTTLPYSTTASHYFNILLRRYFKRNALWLCTLVLLPFAFIPINLNFVYVALMILFLIVPLFIFHLYFSYALLPECRLSLLEKSVEINETGLICHFENHKDEPIAWHKIVRWQYEKNELILFTGKHSFFCLPLHVFSSKEDQTEFIEKYLKKLPR